MAPVEIRVLGPLEVERDGVAVPLGSAMQRRLLIALVLGRGATLSMDRLADALWGPRLPPSARNSLQTYVARLRTSLGQPDVIQTRPPGYALAESAVALDADAFEECLGHARHVLPTDPDAAATLLVAGLRAWRGEAYAEFADDLAHAEATRLAGARDEAQQLLATARLQAGDPTGALEAVHRLVTADPLRETAVITHAEALAALGRRTDALSVLRDYRERLVEELGLDPTEAVAGLERRLLRDEISPRPPPAPDAGPSASATAGHARSLQAPVPASPTVGREHDVERVHGALARSRLVTLVGPGGVGKTRVAAVVAAARRDVTWMDLAAFARDQDVVPMMADALGLTTAGRPVRTALVDAVTRWRGLVVLDNCEHVLDRVAGLLEEVLHRPGPGRILITSRERLDVEGELVVPLTPLPVPAPHAATAADPAVQLFGDRLLAAGGSPVSPAQAATVAAAVDGLPLAIELAAARAVSLPLPVIVERLADQIELVAGTRRRTRDRHGTLANVIAWSHELLDDVDRDLFDRLAVFQTTFRLQDAERICAFDGLSAKAIAPALARLVDQSMVTVVTTEEGHPTDRYRLLQPLRWFAQRQLADTTVGERVRARQRDAVVALAARVTAAIGTSEEGQLITQLHAALPDIRAVAVRAAATGDIATLAQLAGGLYPFGYVQLRLDLLLLGDQVADALDDGRVTAGDIPRSHLAAALAAASVGNMFIERYARARDLGLRAVELAPDDDRAALFAHEALGDVWLQGGDQGKAIAAYTRQLRLAESLDATGQAANALSGLSLARVFHGDVEEGRAVARQAVERARSAGAASVLALAEYAYAEAVADHDPDTALDALGRARRAAASINGRHVEGLCHTADVALRGRHGDPAEALRRYEAALVLWSDRGADGLLLIALRNLVILLVRIGADVEALILSAALERAQQRDSFGVEGRRLGRAVAAARGRVDAHALLRVGENAAQLGDLQATASWAIDVVRRREALIASSP